MSIGDAITDPLSTTFHCLSVPNRRKILSCLLNSNNPIPITLISDMTDINIGTVSRDVSVLERAGLVRTEKDGSYRNVELVTEKMDQAHNYILPFYARDQK
jgi:DNA-binding transcriptional ArsR family regulator